MITLSDIKGVGSATVDKLKVLGIDNVFDAMRFFPSRFVDLSSPISVIAAESGQLNLFEGCVTKVQSGLKTLTVYFKDALAENIIFKATFFNQPYLKNVLKIGQSYRLLAKLDSDTDSFTLINPIFERIDKIARLNGVYTIYPLRGVLGQNLFKNILQSLFDRLMAEQNAYSEIIKEFYTVHFPLSSEEAETAAEKIAVRDTANGMRIYRQSRINNQKKRKVLYNLPKSIVLDFKSALDVTPTASQSKAFEDILADMSSHMFMSRIINGDVGSGKTLTAFFAAYSACRAGMQTAFMAPTAILAAQHYSKFKEISGKLGIKCALLTGGTPPVEASRIRQAAALGEIEVIFGTQSLISDKLKYDRLGLAVIDEQHKFGVGQRAKLEAKGALDVLTLTATPIPRTLALAYFDELKISILKKREEAGFNVKTSIIGDCDVQALLVSLKEKCSSGKKGFIVCPSIRDAEGYVIYSVETIERLLADSGLGYEIIHGHMTAQEKSAVMERFERGETRVLAATSVIEVGIDTSASFILIMNADRFGLSSLHQLRGRVGRDGSEASCFLHTAAASPEALNRLRIIVYNNDGERIAEKDLENRGAGHILGTKQTGLTLTPCLGLPLTSNVLIKARAEADEKRSADVEARFFEEYAPDLIKTFADNIFGVTLNS